MTSKSGPQTPSESIKKFLNQINLVEVYCFWKNNPEAFQHFSYHCVGDYVLDRGKSFESSEPLTEDEFKKVVSAAERSNAKFEPKMCFHNAMTLAMFDDAQSIEYCEGYSVTGLGIPVHHAWNTINGKVIDLTRSLRPEATDEFLSGKAPQGDLKDRVLGTIPDSWAYFGITFDKGLVRDYMMTNECTGSLIGDSQRGFPLWLIKRMGNSKQPAPTEYQKMMDYTGRSKSRLS